MVCCNIQFGFDINCIDYATRCSIYNICNIYNADYNCCNNYCSCNDSNMYDVSYLYIFTFSSTCWEKDSKYVSILFGPMSTLCSKVTFSSDMRQSLTKRQTSLNLRCRYGRAQLRKATFGRDQRCIAALVPINMFCENPFSCAMVRKIVIVLSRVECMWEQMYGHCHRNTWQSFFHWPLPSKMNFVKRVKGCWVCAKHRW